MAAQEGKQWWDPYETSHRKQFVHHPNPAPEILLRPMSTSIIDSYSQSAPTGSTVYSKEFGWKPASKPECIRTGTTSAQRRNNPHPSQNFMVWRLPRDPPPSNDDLTLPCKCSPSEGEIHKALKAQYCSTYTCDFMGMPQGNYRCIGTDGHLAHLHNKHHIQVPLSADSEMIIIQYINRDPPVACCGRVPTVVQRHMQSQQKGSNLTINACRKRLSNVTSVVKFLLPQELQQLHRILTEEEKKTVKGKFSKDACPKDGEKVHKLPAVVQNSFSSEWISSWPGPT
ncbi:LOW QUALITY PROTEIN: testis-expressed protein 26-like [Melanotaenia boesemani]|uniref:LOW QUALITY PROTEIN: testis-expressed protein 26-like n=1 Tax=Melanotaenia boesemani TaxID=1250792 RepID=UPI001C04F63C|nr:LOW QUALITY PROTEIN: testis-expressed protein 26-like [Melanotaenia boesemani]